MILIEKTNQKNKDLKENKISDFTNENKLIEISRLRIKFKSNIYRLKVNQEMKQ